MKNRGRPKIWYEINTWIWLHDLSRSCGRGITLGNVPEEEWEARAELGMEGVWFMGVWERSTAGLGIALENEALLSEFRRALPDFKPEDALGSAYCVRRYRVDDRLGGPPGLAEAREQLARRGIGLLLDFVPNHVARITPGFPSTRTILSRARPRTSTRGPGNSFRPKAGSLPAAGILISSPGRMWSRSMPFIPVSAGQPGTPCWRSPASATGSAAIWPCS